ncbi:hypothetical protein Cf24236_3562 [Citrobacter farmeri]|nr:hypothetical protein Cf24236_3562 [Citrobacter farmeri]CAG0339983.1 hypothetical protein AI3057V1_2021 [Citrobacter freundii]CAH6055044.1 hypothetical protein AI3057V1_2021 [Citrobacter freundii]
MAWPAQAFKVRIIIGTPMCLSLDMVNGGGRNSATSTQAVLTQMVVTLQDAGALDIPLTTVTTLMATLTLLVLLPAFIAVLLTVT